MDVEFGNRTLERCFEREAEAIREWGPEVGHRYVQRIKAVLAAASFDELFLVQALHLHPLQGDRAGEWSLTLQGRWRLVIERKDEHTILVKEVTNHYGD